LKQSCWLRDTLTSKNGLFSLALTKKLVTLTTILNSKGDKGPLFMWNSLDSEPLISTER
jgi:hypothetical protein